jgi:hypothetical protein
MGNHIDLGSFASSTEDRVPGIPILPGARRNPTSRQIQELDVHDHVGGAVE